MLDNAFLSAISAMVLWFPWGGGNEEYIPITRETLERFATASDGYVELVETRLPQNVYDQLTRFLENLEPEEFAKYHSHLCELSNVWWSIAGLTAEADRMAQNAGFASIRQFNLFCDRVLSAYAVAGLYRQHSPEDVEYWTEWYASNPGELDEELQLSMLLFKSALARATPEDIEAVLANFEFLEELMEGRIGAFEEFQSE